MKLYAGIDGGQSSTVAVIADDRGTILGRGKAGPADEVGQTARSVRLRNAISDALARALAQAELPADSRFGSVVAGISGYNGRVIGVEPHVNTARLRLTHDAPIAHYGALGGRPGIIVIAGTGSVVYGVAQNGRSLTLGGWGYAFGDEGSAYWIGVRALNAAMDDEDRDQPTPIWRTACEFFTVRSMREVQAAFATGTLSRDRIASFAQVAIGDPTDGRIEDALESGTQTLARLVEIAGARLGFRQSFGLALTGGLSGSPRYVATFERACERFNLNGQLTVAREEPVMGALRMAMK